MAIAIPPPPAIRSMSATLMKQEKRLAKNWQKSGLKMVTQQVSLRAQTFVSFYIINCLILYLFLPPVPVNVGLITIIQHTLIVPDPSGNPTAA